MTSSWVRGGIAGLAGGVAWLVGIFVIFGPAQLILADPNLQSAKFLAAFTAVPLPRTVENPIYLLVGLLGIGLLWGCVYVNLAESWHGVWWKRGVRFGFIGWVLMVPWFEFYLPWSVLLEPLPLVILEMVCWLGVLLLVGVTIAGVEFTLARKTIAEELS